MNQLVARLRTAVSGLTLLAFALPFLTISCAGAEVPLSGLDLAFGKTLEGGSMLSGSDVPNVIDSQPVVLAAIACAALALVACFPASRSAVLRFVQYASPIGGTLALLLLRFGDMSDVPVEARGIVTVSFSPGYWVALLGFVASFVLVRADEPLGSHNRSVGGERQRPQAVSPPGFAPADHPAASSASANP